jgi:hypothetical protein
MPATPGGDRTEDDALTESVAWDIEYRNSTPHESATSPQPQPHLALDTKPHSGEQEEGELAEKSASSLVADMIQDVAQSLATAQDSSHSDEVPYLQPSFIFFICLFVS